MRKSMIGESIGSYRIVAKLGEGGMGAVYLGEHQRIARRAAIKVLLPQLSNNQDVVARFFNEARATSLIRHPGIIEIIDCDVLPSGNAYIVMELLEGESLGSRLRDKGPLPMKQALAVSRSIADALDAAHAQKIVHRDLKPDNVFLLASGAPLPSPQIKILDFGIAKLIHTNPDGGHYKTRTGSIIGTPVYMSPEQCRGVGTIDHRTDIYSLGCMVLEMLCGRPPFTSEGFGELIQAHLAVAPPTPRSFDAAFPAALDALVGRMLAKSPDDRPPTMAAVVAELDALASNRPPPPAAIGARRAASSGPAASPGPRPLEMPRVQTTLGAASSEKLPVVDFTDEIAIPRRRGGGMWAAVAAVAVVAGGFGAWRVLQHEPGSPAQPSAASSGANPPAASPPATPPGANPVGAAAPTAAPPSVSPPTAAPPSVSPPTATPPSASPPAATPRSSSPVAAAPAPATRSHGKHADHAEPAGGSSAQGSRKVKVAIASEPAGADVCLQSDRMLIGKTKLVWSADRSTQPAKLLIRKRGYRGQELSIVPEHDGTRSVMLDKLGPDDIDDIVNCKSP